MTGDNPLDHEIAKGPLAKLERAKYHVFDLSRQVEEYLSTSPFELRISQSEDPPQRVVYVQAKHTIPDHFALVIGDAVHNLRTALDHLCFGMVGDKTQQPARVGFPFAKAGGQSLDGAITTRQMHLAPEQVIKEIRDLEPYPGGNQYLNAVKILDERDKHHFILTTGTSLVFTVEQMGQLVGVDKVSHIPSGLMIGTVGDFVVPLDGKPKVFDQKADFQPTFTIGLAQGEELGGFPVIMSLRKMVEATQDAILRLTVAFIGD